MIEYITLTALYAKYTDIKAIYKNYPEDLEGIKDLTRSDASIYFKNTHISNVVLQRKTYLKLDEFFKINEQTRLLIDCETFGDFTVEYSVDGVETIQTVTRSLSEDKKQSYVLEPFYFAKVSLPGDGSIAKIDDALFNVFYYSLIKNICISGKMSDDENSDIWDSRLIDIEKLLSAYLNSTMTYDVDDSGEIEEGESSKIEAWEFFR